MGHKAHDGLGARARELRDQIARWRRTREKRSPMPAELWAEAVGLARSGGTYPIARALQVDYESLARRVAEADAGERGGSAPSAAFVELTGAQFLGSSTPAGPVVEVADRDGVWLTIRLPAAAVLDVAEVVAGVRGRRA